ncbi:flagellar hook-associated protein FlgL [Kineococcus rubinsiae]|uniref:flagellar hook-associated protein FlgL n=1 Tax=Kineococcus rubinsiae TaxID=2609562 RepID=UPI00143138E5|nr:flagellar hook-associated protein FlgL [Kineococcus rubinsiae]NIZ93049.1 flagellar hook-associated protein 3 [Kineococcus rubinsiae]
MFSRITNRSIAVGSMTNLQASMNRSNKLQEQLSSGQVLSKPSDDPVVTNNSIQYRTEIGVQEQYGRNNLDGQAWLNSADAALQDSVKVMQRVRDLTVQAANTGANDTTARRAIAIEVDSLKENLLSSANTKYLGRPIFAGTKIGDVAFDATGAFQGDAGVVARRVGPNVDVAANVSGEGAFGDDGATFAMLTDLSTALKSGSGAGINDFITKVDTGLGLLKDSLSTVGARTNQLEALKDTSDARVDSLTDSHNDITAIDLPKTLIEYNLQKTAYETALASTAKVIQPTLMDFLR